MTNIIKNKFISGFTIIELVVVIAVIAVLAVIVTSAVMQYINKSKNAVEAADIAQLFRAGNIYSDSSQGNGGYASICGQCWSPQYITNGSCAAYGGSSQFPQILIRINKMDNKMTFTCADNASSSGCTSNSWAVAAASPYGTKNLMCADYTSKAYLSNNGSNDITVDTNSKCCCTESLSGVLCP